MSTDIRKDIRDIFDAGLAAADPGIALRRFVEIPHEGTLKISGRTYDLRRYRRIVTAGAGKAACSMAAALEDMIGDRITGGLVITKYEYTRPLKHVTVIEGGHPVPDEQGRAGAEKIMELFEQAGEDDLILFLLSGGGSALMPVPVEGVSLEDKRLTTELLLACGASIHEINAIRKHISAIKGGNLARAACPATLVTLILSDVIGDDLDVIASGPTVPDNSTYSDCLAIVDKYHLEDRLPHAVLTHLREGAAGNHPETPKPGDPVFDRTSSLIVGSARLSMLAARERAREIGYNALFLSSFIEGETRDAARFHGALVKEIINSGNPLPRPACIISGGETTVTIRGTGRGGRNMEFVLAAAMELRDIEHIAILSGGTDGTDGPTDAAGAVADGRTVSRARERGINAAACLADNDSYRFFESLGDLIITGPTLTNVMDLRIFIVE